MSDDCCIHGVPGFELCQICDGNELSEHEESVIEILLEHAPLTGAERDRLEEMLEKESFFPEDLQAMINNHIHTIHAAQRNGSHFA